MTMHYDGKRFGTLFKKYRLRSEIESLSEFGDLLAQEGTIYENSLFTRWQKGERVPKDRKVLLTILSVFAKRGGIYTAEEANRLLESVGQRDLSHQEQTELNAYLRTSNMQTLPKDLDIFVGRDKLIKDIAWELISRKNVWLSGLPGTGKTSLAIHISYLLKDIFTDGIFWFRADIKDVQIIVDELLTGLGYDISGVESMEMKLERLSTLVQGKMILLILDNVEHARISSADMQSLTDLPIGLFCTSIEGSTASSFTKFVVSSFTPHEFFLFAETILGKPFVETHKKQLTEVGELLGYLPILSTIILKQIFSKPQQLQEYIDRMRQNRLDLCTVTYDNKNLNAAFEFAFMQLPHFLQKLLVICSLFDGTDFALAPLSSLAKHTRKETKKYLSKLTHLSFINNSVERRYRLHPAVKSFLSNQAIREDYLLLGQYYLRQLSRYPIGSARYINYLFKEYENILRLLERAYNLSEYQIIRDIWPLISTYIFYSGRWYLMHKYDRLIRDSYKKIKDDRGFAIYLLEDIGRIYFFQNDREKTDEMFEKCEDIAQRLNDRILKGLLKQKYGVIASYEGRLDDAEKFLLQSLKYLTKSNMRDEIIKSHSYIGVLYAQKGHFKQAIKYLNKAYDSSHFLKDDAIIGFTLIYLGQAYLKMNNFSQAEKYFIRGYKFEKKRHVKVGKAMALKGLGEVYKADKDKKQSIRYLKKALILYKELHMTQEIKLIEVEINNKNSKINSG